MGLADELRDQEKLSRERMPDAFWSEIDKTTERLRLERLSETCAQVGDAMPSFELPNALGQIVCSIDLLRQGPLVASFYRGGW